MRLLWAKVVAIAAAIVAAAVWIGGLLRIRREVEETHEKAKKEAERIKRLTDKELQDDVEKKVR